MRGFLKNSDVGGGSVVDLSIRTITANWDVYLQNNPTPAKSTLPWNPHEVDFMGVGNQKFIIRGHFIEGSPAEPKTGSAVMQIALLGSFCNIGSPSWFILDSAYFLAGTASIQVLPSAPSWTHDYRNENHIDYTITLTETKEW